MSRNLATLYPDFKEKIDAVIADLNEYAAKNMKGYKWIVTDTFRTTSEQQRKYAQGRTVPGDIITRADGVKNRSNHQSSLAVDIAPVINNALDYEVDKKHWDYYGHVARQHGLDWGGDWKTIVDKPHCEWPPKDKKTYAAAREWQHKLGLD